jgi:UDP-glucose 4-epimerase
MTKNILLTGGCGFIGSHACVSLLQEGYKVHIVDNLYNSHKNIIDKIEVIVNEEQFQNLTFHYCDLCDYNELETVFKTIPKVDTVIHFAGLKSVKESVSVPLLYYYNNLLSTINLLQVMKKYNCFSLIFSSSATVYGNAEPPLSENTVTGYGITNPYGKTKYMIEEILKDEYKSHSNWKMVFLRYFNPVGAHPSGIIGEYPNSIPNNLMPYVMKVAGKELDKITIFGDDYDTKDGSAVRDYIHVMDLVEGHLVALRFIMNKNKTLEIFNLGSGVGTTVKEMIKMMKKVSGQEVPSEIGPRRQGDLAIVFCEPSKAKSMLNWKTKLSVEDMCRDLWNYFKRSKEA